MMTDPKRNKEDREAWKEVWECAVLGAIFSYMTKEEEQMPSTCSRWNGERANLLHKGEDVNDLEITHYLDFTSL